jgi:MauM/NapG family ferredoxin protein
LRFDASNFQRGGRGPRGRPGGRTLVRGICLALAVVAVSPLASGTFLAAVVPALSPFVALGSMLATRSVHALAWVGLIVGVALLLHHRLFCRWVCPAGLCFDGAAWLGQRCGRRTGRVPRLGPWVLGLTLGGACLGYPVFLWLDPLARFAGLGVLGGHGSVVGLVFLVGSFVALLLLALLSPQLWCTRLCPLGTLQDLPSWLSQSLRSGLRPRRNDGTSGSRVSGHNVAAHPRSMGVPPMSSTAVPAVSRSDMLPGTNSENHEQGQVPARMHPCFGIRAHAARGQDVRATMATQGHHRQSLARRTLLAVGAGAVGAAALRSGYPGKPGPFRPPGALAEPVFGGVCTRCGNCVRACPSGIIEHDLKPGGWASLLTPVLRFRRDYCREDCVRCTEVCPSGALVRMSPEDKKNVRLGLPQVDMSVCLLAQDRECSLCRSQCPYDAVRYLWSETDYTLTPQVDAEKCTGCGACEAACPTTPRKAIVVLPV